MIGQVLECSEEIQGLATFGYNIDVVYEIAQPDVTANQFLGDRLFRGSVGELGTILGGSGNRFRDGEGRGWELQMEPRFNDHNTTKVYLTLNLHYERQTIPSREDIRGHLQELHDQLLRVIKCVERQEA